jgi:L-alanine-DL-glutamate epimerase-like enolase superfamily enzyme
MKIVSTEIIVLSDPPPEKSGHTWGTGPLAVLRIRTDDGITGTSEIFSVPPDVAKAALDGPDSWFGKLLVGQDLTHPERLWTLLYNSMLHGNRRGWAVICIGAADVALWDIYGKAMDLPVYELLGGIERSGHQVYSESQSREAVPYCTIVPDHGDRDRMISEQLERIEKLLAMGFRAFKVEPMRSAPEAVVECARQARQLIGPDLSLAVDVGYGLNDVPTASWICDRLAESDVMFFETPFPVDHIDAYAALARQSPVPLAMGEHAVSRWEFLQMMDYGGVEVVQPYAVTVGGLTEAKRVVDLAHQRGVSVIPGNWSTHIQMAANVHLCAYSPITPFFEYAPPEVYWSPLRKAIGEVGLSVIHGAVAFPSGPGIGVELPDDLIKHFRID